MMFSVKHSTFADGFVWDLRKCEFLRCKNVKLRITDIFLGNSTTKTNNITQRTGMLAPACENQFWI